MKRQALLSFAAVALLCIVLVGVADGVYASGPNDTTTEPSEPTITDITISPSSLNLYPGDSRSLEATIRYSDGSIGYDTVSWRSTNNNVVRVESNGNYCTVTAIGSGDATIIAEAGDRSASCRVHVIQVTITLDKTDITTLPGAYVSVDVNVSPTDVAGELRVESSNYSVATWTFDDDIHALSEGNATLTFTVKGVTARCNVEVIGGSIYSNNNQIEITVDMQNGVSLSGDVNRYDTNPGYLTATVSSGGVQNGSITTAASNFLKLCLQIVDDSCSWSPDIRVEFDGGSATKMSIDSNAMSAIAGSGASLDASSDNGGVYLDKTSMGRLGSGAWSFTISEVENTSSVEGAKLFEVIMTSGNTKITSVAGNATFTIPYDVGDPIQASSISTFAVSADGSTTPLSTSYDAIDGSVSFTAKSWYRFGVSEVDVDYGGTGTSTLSYVVMAVIVILAVICVILCYRYLRM